MCEMSIEKRVFVVGCPRSGTTLLQSRIGSHPDVQTFPETFFFTQSVGLYRLPIAWLGLGTGRQRETLEQIIGDRKELRRLLRRKRYWFLRDAVADYVRVLDTIAEEGGRRVWVEKTPEHLFYAGLIHRYIDDAHVIHLARRGEDVVASIADRAQENPGRFGWESVDSAIRKWNWSMYASSLYFGRPRHHFVVYERLVESPESVLREVAASLGLGYAESMLAGDPDVLRRVTPPWRPWLSKAREPIRPAEDKFTRLFDEDQRRRISAGLRSGLYDRFCKHQLSGQRWP